MAYPGNKRYVQFWLITGTVSMAGAIAGIEVITKMFLYYGHERVWNKIKWGKDKTDHSHMFSHEDWKVKRVKNYPDKKGNKRLAKLLFD